MGLVAVGGMQALELLLPCCILKVHKHSLAFHCVCVLVQGQGVCGKQLGLKSIHEKSLQEFGLAHSAVPKADDLHFVIR